MPAGLNLPCTKPALTGDFQGCGRDLSLARAGSQQEQQVLLCITGCSVLGTALLEEV